MDQEGLPAVLGPELRPPAPSERQRLRRGAFEGYKNPEGSMRAFVTRLQPDGSAELVDQPEWTTGLGTSLAPAEDGAFWLAAGVATLSRWSSQGVMQWSASACRGYPTGVAVGQDGTRVMIVWGAGEPADYELCVAKWDAQGTLLWEYSHEAGYELRGVVVDAQGAIYAAGRGGVHWDQDFWGPGKRRAVSYAFLLKLDANGELSWERQWGGERSSEALALTLGAEGGVVVTGSSMDMLTAGPSRPDAHAFVGRWV